MDPWKSPPCAGRATSLRSPGAERSRGIRIGSRCCSGGPGPTVVFGVEGVAVWRRGRRAPARASPRASPGARTGASAHQRNADEGVRAPRAVPRLAPVGRHIHPGAFGPHDRRAVPPAGCRPPTPSAAWSAGRGRPASPAGCPTGAATPDARRRRAARRPLPRCRRGPGGSARRGPPAPSRSVTRLPERPRYSSAGSAPSGDRSATALSDSSSTRSRGRPASAVTSTTRLPDRSSTRSSARPDSGHRSCTALPDRSRRSRSASSASGPASVTALPARFTRRSCGTAPRPVRSFTARRGAASVAATGPGAWRSASASAASRPRRAFQFWRVRGERVRRIVREFTGQRQRQRLERRRRLERRPASRTAGRATRPGPPSGAAADGTYASRTAPVARLGQFQQQCGARRPGARHRQPATVREHREVGGRRRERRVQRRIEAHRRVPPRHRRRYRRRAGHPTSTPPPSPSRAAPRRSIRSHRESSTTALLCRSIVCVTRVGAQRRARLHRHVHVLSA